MDAKLKATKKYSCHPEYVCNKIYLIFPALLFVDQSIGKHCLLKGIVQQILRGVNNKLK